MAKDKSEKKDKKEKKEKKEKLSEKNGVSKSSKKEKKERKLVVPEERAEAILQDIENRTENAAIKPQLADESNGDVKVDAEVGAGEEAEKMVLDIKPKGALVPFANPLADERVAKKVFKGVKKAAKAKALKRGVKEVVKSLRKSALATTSSASETPLGVVVIAADISPMDVISHLPVLCEDHGVPYVYVTSRAELGAAGSTKRPTSVVMVGKEKGKGAKKEGEEEKDDWGEVYGDLVKVVKKAGRDVRI